MKKVLFIIILCVALSKGGAPLHASSTPPQKTVDVVHSTLVQWVTDSIAGDCLRATMDSERREHLKGIPRTRPRFTDKAPKGIHIEKTISINPI